MKTARRVLVVHSSDEMYGSDRVLLDLLKELSTRGWAFDVVLPADIPGGGQLRQCLQEAGISVRSRNLAVMRRRYMNPLGLLLYGTRLAADVFALWRIVKTGGHHIVYSNTSAVISGALMAAIFRLGHVWHVHEIVERPAPVSTVMRRLVNRLSPEVIVVSRAVARWLATDHARVTVIHNGLSDPLIGEEARQRRRAELLGSRRGPLVGWIGRIGAWKGHEVFLEFARLALTFAPEAVFVLAGGPAPGDEEVIGTVQNSIREIGSDAIRFLGLVPDGPALVASLDLLVACPTRPDPFPRIVQEAQWQGVAVLGVATGGIPELIEDGVTGILISDSDPAALTSGFKALLAGQKLGTLGAAARMRAEAEWGIGLFGDSVESVLDRAQRP